MQVANLAGLAVACASRAKKKKFAVPKAVGDEQILSDPLAECLLLDQSDRLGACLLQI